MNKHIYQTVLVAAISMGGVITPCVIISTELNSSGNDEAKLIESVLNKQDACWNRGDIDGFMETYWNSEALTFSGGGKVTRGWQGTLDRYKENYPREKMGKLHFDELEIQLLGQSNALVLGQWHLDINGEKRDGNFSLIMRKFGDDWKIIHDHSSSLETEKGWLSVEQAEVVGKLKLELEAVRSQPFGRYVLVEPVAASSAADQKTSVYVDRKTAEVLKELPAEQAIDEK